MVAGILIGSIIFLIVLIILMSSIYTVKQQTAAVIERFGKYSRTAGPGIHLKWPFGIDSIVARPSLRIQQLDLEMQSKTKDDVTVTLRLAIQYVVPGLDKIYDSYYKLVDPSKQIEAWVFDVVRSKVPTLLINGVYENKDEIAKDVEDTLKDRMHLYGFQIVRVLVNDVVPPTKVLDAMNEVNTQQRLQAAAEAQGLKEKILVVKAAEAQKENKILQGQGIAGERKAIMEGLKEAIEDFKEGIPGATSATAMNLLVLTQFFDTLQTFGKSGNAKVILLPSNPGAVGDWQNQITTALMASNESSK
jgi:regulator of protease activity HflC (stomatin/prohibitin superfamily)